MKLKLIDENWIDEQIKIIGEEQCYDKEDTYLKYGQVKSLELIKEKLQSSKEEIINALFHGYKLALDNMTEDSSEITNNNIENYLKENGYV